MTWERSNPRATETMIWHEQHIRVEAVRDKTANRGTTAGSIIADTGKIAVKTRFMRKWGVNDVVVFRGKTYVITDISGKSYDVGSQSLSYVRPDRFMETTLELFEVNEQTRNLRVPTPVLTSDGSNVTITVPDVMGASIYYETATEGKRCNNPSSLSNKYSSAIPIGSGSTQIKTIAAIALKEGYLPSVVAVWRDD